MVGVDMIYVYMLYGGENRKLNQQVLPTREYYKKFFKKNCHESIVHLATGHRPRIITTIYNNFYRK